MRKLRKMNLDELAQEMPVLSEEEQRTHEGGAFYYTRSGSYLGKVGDSTDIRIIDENTYYRLSGSANGVGMDVVSSQLSYMTDSSLIAKIVGCIARDANISSGFSMGYFAGNGYAITDISGNIFFNYNAPCFGNTNYYDFLLTLCHEKQHSDTMYDYGSDWSEYEAYRCVIEHPDFQYSSIQFQRGIMKEFQRYSNK